MRNRGRAWAAQGASPRASAESGVGGGLGTALADGGVARAKGRGKGTLGATQQPEGVAGSGAQLRWGRSSSKLLKQARPYPRGSRERPCSVPKLRSSLPGRHPTTLRPAHASRRGSRTDLAGEGATSAGSGLTPHG